MTSVCIAPPSRARRSPTAAATAPPTPESTSSKIRVLAGSFSARATLRASRKRASSPPDAILSIAPSAMPGFVLAAN